MSLADINASEITGERKRFLTELTRWNGAAATRDLGPQTAQKQNSARQWCRVHGLVTFEGGYWRLTEAGRSALTTPAQKVAS